MNDFGFDVNEYKTDEESNECLLDGKYICRIALADIRPTKRNQEGLSNSENFYIEYEVQVPEEHKGVIVKEWLCIENDPDKKVAQRIARENLHRLGVVLSIDHLKNPNQLTGKFLIIETVIEKSEGYRDKPKIVKYLRVESEQLKKYKLIDQEKEFDDSIPF